MKTIQDIIRNAQLKDPVKMVVAVAEDDHVLDAVHMAKQAGIIDAILIGDEAKIKEIMLQLKMPLSDYQIVHESDPASACEKAVKMISSQQASILMKGLVDTSIILKAALDKVFGLRTPNRISHVSVMEIPLYHKLLMMTDGAMNMYPDVDIKQEIVENAVSIAHAIGIKNPHVGCIAAIEKINPKMQATLDAQELIQRQQDGRIKGCIIGGPFALDNAINKEAALHKGVVDPMAGDVDILLMPQIETGNVFYKSMMFLAHAKSASVIAGATHPIVLTSRADSKETKFNSIALAALVA